MSSDTQILGLYLYDPEYPTEQILHAVSPNRHILENLIDNIDSEYKRRSLSEIKPICVYGIIRIIAPVPQNEMLTKIKLYHGEKRDLLLMYTQVLSMADIHGKLFGFQLGTKQTIVNVMNDAPYDSDEYKNHLSEIRKTFDLSDDYIEMDKYYDEGVMNVYHRNPKLSNAEGVA